MVDTLPAWKGPSMYRIGRLTMVKTTLLTMPIYTAISIHMPHWLQKALVRISKSFLWSGTDVVQGGKCLVAWSHVARPLDLGGLGVLDLNLMGRALRLRWLWLSRPDHLGSPTTSQGPAPPKRSSRLPFAALWVAATPLSFGTTHGWKVAASPISHELVAVVAPRAWKRSVVVVLTNGTWICDIAGPLTVPILVRYLQIRQRLEGVTLDLGTDDQVQ
jgi:hypothetical protein